MTSAVQWPFPEKLIECRPYSGPRGKLAREAAIEEGDPPW